MHVLPPFPHSLAKGPVDISLQSAGERVSRAQSPTRKGTVPCMCETEPYSLMVARFRGWRRCWRSPRGHEKLPEVFIGQLGPAREGRNKNQHSQRVLQEEQVLCDRDGHQVPVERAQRLECTSDFHGNWPGVPQCCSSPSPGPQGCTHWWKECESSTSWPSGARGLENGSSGGQERESSDSACTASPRERCPPVAPSWIPARAHPGRPAQDTGVPVSLPDPQPRGSAPSRGCPRAPPGLPLHSLQGPKHRTAPLSGRPGANPRAEA